VRLMCRAPFRCDVNENLVVGRRGLFGLIAKKRRVEGVVLWPR